MECVVSMWAGGVHFEVVRQSSCGERRITNEAAIAWLLSRNRRLWRRLTTNFPPRVGRRDVQSLSSIETRWYRVRYDTIRDAILTCARKPTWVSLIYRTEPTTTKCKTEKLKSKKRICSKVAVNSLGNPCSQSWRWKRRLRREVFAEKEGFKPGAKEWWGDGILIIIRMTVGSSAPKIPIYFEAPSLVLFGIRIK